MQLGEDRIVSQERNYCTESRSEPGSWEGRDGGRCGCDEKEKRCDTRPEREILSRCHRSSCASGEGVFVPSRPREWVRGFVAFVLLLWGALGGLKQQGLRHRENFEVLEEGRVRVPNRVWEGTSLVGTGVKRSRSLRRKRGINNFGKKVCRLER